MNSVSCFRVYVMIMLCNFYPGVYRPTSNIVDLRSLDIEPQGVEC